MESPKNIKDKIDHYQEECGSSCLVAVSKYTDDDSVRSAYSAGHRDFGESRVPDLLKRSILLEQEGLTEISWHFIGHIQTNKLNKLLTVPNLAYLHSVDSLKLLTMILDRSKNLKLKLFFQLKTSDESEKYGATFDEVCSMVELLRGHSNKNVELVGVMTIGKVRTDDFEGEAVNSFNTLKELGLKLEAKYSLPKLKLSMGMSSDYQFALKLGSDFIRIGSGIFGAYK